MMMSSFHVFLNTWETRLTRQSLAETPEKNTRPQRKWQDANYTHTKRVGLYIRESLKMHLCLWLDTILLNPRKVHSTTPYMADPVSTEGTSKMKEKQKAYTNQMRKLGEWN